MKQEMKEQKKYKLLKYDIICIENMKMWPYWQLPFIYRLKLYALFINREMRLPFIDSDL